MKLSEDIKKRIDNYFENISAQDLYETAVSKFCFKENNEIDLDNQSFSKIGQNYYRSNLDNRIDLDKKDHNTTPLAA